MKYLTLVLLILSSFKPKSQTNTTACVDSVAIYALQSPLAGINLYSRLPLANGDMLIYNIVAGSYFNDTSYSDYIIRLDSSGRLKQGYKIKIAGNTGNAQRFHFAAAAPDGGFALGGERYKRSSDSTSFYHVVYLRFDANMNLVWQKEMLPLTNPNYAESSPFHLKTMGFSPDGQLLFAVNFNTIETGGTPLYQNRLNSLAGPGTISFSPWMEEEICNGVSG